MPAESQRTGAGETSLGVGGRDGAGSCSGELGPHASSSSASAATTRLGDEHGTMPMFPDPRTNVQVLVHFGFVVGLAIAPPLPSVRIPIQSFA